MIMLFGFKKHFFSDSMRLSRGVNNLALRERSACRYVLLTSVSWSWVSISLRSCELFRRSVSRILWSLIGFSLELELVPYTWLGPSKLGHRSPWL